MVEEAARHGASGKTPSPSDSSARMFEIAETVHRREEAERYRRCEEKGPAAKLWDRMDNLETWRHDMELELAEKKGAARELASEAVRKATGRTVLISMAGSAVVGLVLLAANRFWPPQAQAQQPAHVQQAARP